MEEVEETDLYQNAFERLEEEDILERVQESTGKTVGERLEAVDQELELNHSEAKNEFSDSQRQLDNEEVEPSDMKIQEFKQSLGNHLISLPPKEEKEMASDQIDPIDPIAEELPVDPIQSENATHLQIKKKKPKASWIRIFLDNYSSEVMDSFEQFSQGAKEIDLEKSKNFTRNLLKLINLKVPEEYIEEFFYELHKLNSLSQIIQSIEIWAQTHKDLLGIFANQLEFTCLEYKKLEVKYREVMDISEFNHELGQFAKKCRKLSINESEKGCQEVFFFYSRALLSFSIRPSFDEIESHNTTLALPKFMKFCVDFDLMANNAVTKQTLMAIFKRNSTNGLLMNYQQFSSALDLIAEAMYSEQYDDIHGTSYTSLPLIEKREQLFKFLELNNRKKYMKKVKGFGRPFRSGKEERISEDDTSRLYQFRKPKLKMIREEYYFKPAVHLTPKAPPPKPSPKLSPKPIKYRIRGQGYRTRPANESTNLITFQSLENDLVYSFYGQRYFSQEMDDSDDYLKKIYGKKIKSIDDSIDRGIKVAMKSRLSN